MKNIVFIKFGGSLITDKSKPFTVRPGTIKRLSKELHKARSQSEDLFILGHGGGSYPHFPATKYKTADGVIDNESFRGIAEVQEAAAELNRIVVKDLIKAGESAMSLSPSSMMTSKNKKPNTIFLDSLYKLLEFKMLPVFYGDVVLDELIGCTIFSTETVLGFLANKLKNKFKIKTIIYCGVTDGVYGEDGKTISKITSKNFGDVEKQITGSAGIDVTGGMLHKVKEALALANEGINSVIINGDRTNELYKAIMGEKIVGTQIGS